MDGFVDLPNCLKYRDLRGLWDRNRALLGRRVLWKNEVGKGYFLASLVCGTKQSRLVVVVVRNELVSVTDNTDAKGFVDMHVGYKKVARRSRGKKAYRRRRLRQEETIGYESRKEKSGPRFAGCDGGAKSGLSHVDFGVKATIYNADEESARAQTGVKWPEGKEEKEKRRVPYLLGGRKGRPNFSSSDSAGT
ncbi:hypothetical protein PCH_Pc22g03190 [Penicillium rubens Wisconsin 54-1255]|uniref:Uncharacterized protein n=1 Tax=Penicillium rubens (strain ATCC 28089 / DSM 1075 / NRRL 1951 / Wisconsin 54-1255) TaxID=500485 RepID=B6HRA8_PENRW|nr:hypothetical protein PCH_Pc22g03190 [Penicillium rubens Wisconsin 54-1255]